MDDIQAYTKTLRALDEEIKAVEEYILDGAPADDIAYQKAVSRRLGLLFARELVVDKFGRADSEE